MFRNMAIKKKTKKREKAAKYYIFFMISFKIKIDVKLLYKKQSFD